MYDEIVAAMERANGADDVGA
ncbi:MAG: hypothetical protein JWQ97_2282, partial [Phenylobacterium sp.]|nr:hypothetical protein [Phenylobacterium sp.]